jgi:hypothetical protein
MATFEGVLAGCTQQPAPGAGTRHIQGRHLDHNFEGRVPWQVRHAQARPRAHDDWMASSREAQSDFQGARRRRRAALGEREGRAHGSAKSASAYATSPRAPIDARAHCPREREPWRGASSREGRAASRVGKAGATGQVGGGRGHHLVRRALVRRAHGARSMRRSEERPGAR